MGNVCPCISPNITEKQVEVNLVNAAVSNAIKTILNILRKNINKESDEGAATLNNYFLQININNSNILEKLKELPAFVYPHSFDSTNLILKQPTQLDNGSVYAGYW